MKVGTKSLLFGVHQVFIHPVYVFIAWWKLFGFPRDPRLWVAFIVHDWGYWGKSNMDGKDEGETHPELGAKIMHRSFDKKCEKGLKYISRGNECYIWYNFTLYHSRFYAKNDVHPISRLCIADKYVFCLENKWFYILRAKLSGELYEYMDENKGRAKIPFKNASDWFDYVYKYMQEYVKDEIDKLTKF
jgi:hypothetical protein